MFFLVLALVLEDQYKYLAHPGCVMLGLNWLQLVALRNVCEVRK